MYCEVCGKKLNQGDKFCMSCGTKIEDNSYSIHNNSIYAENISQKKHSNSKIIILALLSICIGIGVGIGGFYGIDKFKADDIDQTTEAVSENLYFNEDDAEEDDIPVVDITEGEKITTVPPSTVQATSSSSTTYPATRPGTYYAVDRNKMYSSDWIFPTDQLVLTEDYLERFTRDELLYLTNEIYARHGYIFKNDKYYNYFITKDWYFPRIYSMDEVTELFNQTEHKNIKVIVDFEKSKGYRE